MRLIQREWENSNLGHVQYLLDETRLNPQRGWEWHYWNHWLARPPAPWRLSGATIAAFSSDDCLAISDYCL